MPFLTYPERLLFIKVIESDIFWNAKGVLLVNYVEKSYTITEANHTSLLRQLQKKIQNIQHEEKKFSRTTFKNQMW